MRVVFLLLLLLACVAAYEKVKSARPRNTDDLPDLPTESEEEDLVSERAAAARRKKAQQKKRKQAEEEDDYVDEEEEVKPEKKVTKKVIKKKPKQDEVSEEAEEDAFWEVCENTPDEACHCEMHEVKCDNIVFESDSPLETLDVDIKDTKFVAHEAFFRDNVITHVKKGHVLRGHESTVSVLDVTKNKIVKIDAGALASFTNLSILHLSHNMLKSYKKEMLSGGPETSLHQLYLDNNRITKLPAKVFSNLENLHKLVLDGNKIEITKDTFYGLGELEELSIDWCNLKSLDENVFDHLTSLKTLSLRGNNFTEIPRAVNALPNLENLDISYTQITEFHSGMLKEDHNVKFIIMDNMEYLWSIQDCAFCGLSNLEELSINECHKLYDLDPNAFGWSKNSPGKVENLHTLHLENANVSKIEEDLLDFDKLNRLYIGGNPVTCDCDTMFLLEEEIYDFEFAKNVPRCAAPFSVKGKPLSSVKQSSVCETVRSRHRSTRFMQWFFMLLLACFVSALVYYLITSGRFSKVFQKPRMPEVSYASLHRNDDEQSLERDFQPRAQEV